MAILVSFFEKAQHVQKLTHFFWGVKFSIYFLRVRPRATSEASSQPPAYQVDRQQDKHALRHIEFAEAKQV
ncbi:MAG TPA: hypothetical protein VIX18_00255, partial [Nitrospirota bacterium]